MISLVSLMSTLESVPRSRKIPLEPNITTSANGEDSSPEKVQATEPAEFISSLKQFSIDKRRYKHYGTLMTGQDLEKITQATKSEMSDNNEQEPASSSKVQYSPKIEKINERDAKLAEVKTPKQKSISTSTPATSLLSPLASINTSISTEKTEGRPQFGEGMMGDIMQLKIEQEKTKQMQLKCELSRSVAELLKNAEGHGQATEVIKRLFFETLQDTLSLHDNTSQPQSTLHPVIPSSIRSAHSSPQLQTQIVIPEPHLAPSPSKFVREIPRKRPLSTLSLSLLQTHYSCPLKSEITEKRDSNDETKQENLPSVEDRTNRSPMSEQQSRRPSPPNSTFESISGTRALSLADSTSGRSASRASSVLGSLSMSNIHSGAMIKDQTAYEDAQRDSNVVRMYQASTPGVSGMYPVYFAPYPTQVPPHDLSRQIILQDHTKQSLPKPIDQISPESKTHFTRHQVSLPKQDGSQPQYNTPHSLDHLRQWLHPHHLYSLQLSQGSSVPTSRGNLPAITYLEGAQTSVVQNRPASSSEQGNILTSGMETRPSQQNPQLSPQHGQQLYYMNSAPVSVSSNSAYVPSHYFIPPPLQPGMVSWVPSAVAPDKRREEEEAYGNKKRRGLKSGISFMISTPQNPPARKYNKLL